MGNELGRRLTLAEDFVDNTTAALAEFFDEYEVRALRNFGPLHRALP